ncbi:coenzyme F390 synthetase [Methanomethylovorans hollandica DSM 15978]|uniref:Coenzyme F390 synthetase n=1 Tax=Methanomethylovorans hollandica (strain DSM 15978 / NBRC 107637 / DMS1) TaxID=867904 RepID=L0KXC1_METHD|nr:AMP-binding protein [Methanomethylovorans hollandica]AGB48634.1 coenzyme F390 synthetase [Methanomethylovorans hollandica DSM 15978]
MSLSAKINTAVRMNIAKRRLESRKIESGAGNPLEQWGLAKIRNDIKNSKELKELFGNQELDRELINEYKLFRFRELMGYVMENSPYYKELYEKTGINPSQITKYEDLKNLPLTEQKQLADHPYHFLCVSRREIVREFTSSGTTNMLKRMAYTQHELLEIVDSVISGLKMAGMDAKDDTLQIMYPTITATWDPGLVLSKACALSGYNSVINDSLDADEQIKTMRESGTTIIIGTSSFLYELSKAARELIQPGELGIKRIICSSEPLTPSMRKEIEEVWGCKTLRQWGMTELGLANAIECVEQNGFHLNNPDFLVEIIDPKTGKQLLPGEEGELVVTTLRRRCMPLIRYRTRDITTLIEEPCTCGACLDQRISDIKRMTS